MRKLETLIHKRESQRLKMQRDLVVVMVVSITSIKL
jgi:hypothetical protein